MKFDLPKKEHPNLERYHTQDVDNAHHFANELYRELGSFLRAAVVFGSATREIKKEAGDIDLLIVLDDVMMHMTPEVVEAYRVIVNRLIVKISTRLHITTLKFTAFWEFARNGDPVIINILRDGVALVDSGFFDPLQVLLKRGRIRPTKESIWTYYARAPNTLYNSKGHILQATIDLYWAVIDSAHAALMKVGEIPPSPDHVADMMQRSLVRKKMLEASYVHTMRNFYTLMKKISHREIKEISGQRFDALFVTAEDFVKRMRRIIDDELQ